MRRLTCRIGLALVTAAALCTLVSASASASTLSDFMDRSLFQPHHSPITGAMVINNAAWYGVDVLPQLVILAAETSFGDPKLGGELARHYNFGCLRYGSTSTKWGALANGKVRVAGLDWFSFPNAQTGMIAFGRYLKLGRNGALLKALAQEPYDWESFADAYYGDTSGRAAYVQQLEHLEDVLRAKADNAGVEFDQ